MKILFPALPVLCNTIRGSSFGEEQTDPLKNLKSWLQLQYLISSAKKQGLTFLVGESLGATLELTRPSGSPGAAEGN